MSFNIKPVLAAILAAGLATPALADDAALLKQMQEQMQQMQAQIEAMSKKLAAQGEKQEKVVAQVAKSEEEGKARTKAVQLYGQLRLSADNYSSDFGTGTAVAGVTPGGKGTTIKSNASRFGIQGEIPTSLDDTSMIYRAEVLYGAADNTLNEIQWREAFAGMKGNWGQARLGRFDVAYKTTLTAIDPWNDNAPQSRGFSGVQGSSALHSSYFTNTAEYVSPSLNGFKVAAWVSTQLDDENSNIHDAGPISNYQGGDAKGFGVKFNQGPWYAAIDWIDINSDRIGTTASTTPFTFTANTKMHNDSGWQMAGGYKAGNWSVGAFYEDVADLGLGKNVYMNGTYKLGKTTLIATYGQNRDATQFFNRDIDTWSLGAKHALTKDSELFAAWVNRSEDAYLAPAATAAKDYQILTVGINAKFGY
ncbi:MAG: porin [Pseudomonadota bacterium]|nr:porin [Pseudomonadota bacterium]